MIGTDCLLSWAGGSSEAVRKRRLVLGAAAVALAGVLGLGAWLATSPDEPPAQDNRQSVPITP
ncbi:hypothetical protein ACM614_01425 [Streptomyces sp. 12297]